MSDVILVSPQSRYKSTGVFATDDGTGVEFGLFEEPVDFLSVTAGYGRHRVRENEIGFLDLLAVKYFGPGSESLWWILALVNGMIDPEQEMFSGMVILIPPTNVVSSFIARAG